MIKIKRCAVLLAAGVAGLLLTGCGQRQAAPKLRPNNPYTDSEFSLGTICKVTVYDSGKQGAVKDGLKTIRHIDSEATLTRSGSVLDKINANAGIKPVRVPKDFWPLLKKAQYFSENSNGSFDMAIGAVTNLWKIGLPGARVPKPAEITAALPLVNWRDVQFNAEQRTVYLTKKGMRLDFGGIAKGWVADEVRRTLKQDGVTTAIIDLGGNVIVMGHSPKAPGRKWTVGIQDPKASRGTPLGTIHAANMSVVTAGTYEQYLMSHGHKYIYLFNAKTGYPYDNNLASVTIVSKQSVDGDALSNAAFDKGLNGGLAYMNKKRHQDIEAIFVTNSNKVYITNGLKSDFKLVKGTKYRPGNFKA